MGNAKHIGRVGASAVVLGIGNVWRSAMRITVTIGAAVLVVMAAAVPAPIRRCRRLCGYLPTRPP